MSRHHVAERLADVLALPPGPVDLAKLPTGTTPGFDGGKRAGKRALAELAPTVSNLQERLFAEGHTGGTRSLLLVLQGMDTSGKGGTLRHSVGLVDPQGVRITSFKAPTRQELRHDFLWRIRKALPEPGYLGIFDRSHYEDVLVARVHELVPRKPGRSATTSSTSSNASSPATASPSSSVSCTCRRRSRRSGWPLGWRTRRSTGSTTRATSTSAPGGRTTRSPTRRRWNVRTPTPHRGMSCQPTASGTATSPSPSFWWRGCRTWIRSGRPRTTTSRANSPG